MQKREVKLKSMILVIGFVILSLVCLIGASCQPIKICLDSDRTQQNLSGRNYFLKGVAHDTDDVIDECADSNTVREAYCNDEEIVVTEDYACPNGCLDGACIKNENSSCTINNFKFAFVLLGRDQGDISQEGIDKLNEIKTQFSTDFAYATDNLATADVSYPVQIIVDNGSLMYSGQTEFRRYMIAKKFLESNPDEFDFIVAYTAFPGETSIMDCFNVDSDAYGIGQDDFVDYINQLEEEYDYKNGGIRTDRLKSVVYLSYRDGLVLTNMDSAAYSNGILHEIGHQWCCYVGDDFAKGQNDAQLEIIQQGIHFYRGLQSPTETGDPMRSDNWVPNGDGSFRRDNMLGVGRYHPFHLYFMGLLNETDYDFDTKFQIYNAGIVGEDFNDQNAVPYKSVSINDIIAVEGSRRCG